MRRSLILFAFFLLPAPAAWSGPAVSTGTGDRWSVQGCNSSPTQADGQLHVAFDPETDSETDPHVQWDPIEHEFVNPRANPDDCVPGA